MGDNKVNHKLFNFLTSFGGKVSGSGLDLFFCFLKVFPAMIATLGSAGSYFFFSVVCGLTAAFSFFFVPDTRGKTSAQLETLYRKN